MPKENIANSNSKVKTNPKIKTKYQGIYQRESNSRKHNGKPDICFFADYYIKDDKGNSRRTQKVIGWLSEGVSAIYASRARAKLMSENKPTQAGEITLTLKGAFDKYYTEWIIGHKKRDSGISSMFKNLQSWHHVKLHDINPYLLDTIIVDLKNKSLSAQSIRYTIGIIKRVVHKMQVWGLFDGNITFKKISLPKVNNQRQRFLTPEQTKILLPALKEKSYTVYLQALIAIHCGLRFSEIAALTHSDIDFYSKTINIKDSKSGKSRQAILTKTLEAELCTLPKNNNLLFPSRKGTIQKEISKTFERVVDALGYNTASDGTPITDAKQKLVFHSLRHTYASWLAISGQNQVMIADLMGHSSLEMTKRYTHLFPDARRGTGDLIDNLFNHK